MALVKHNNNSISNITSFAQIPAGKPVLLSTATASSSASIEFTSGIDSTYDIYKFEFHPQTNATQFRFNGSTDGGSNYNVTKTSTDFYAYHNESDTATGLTYDTGIDLAQSTSDQSLCGDTGNANDDSISGSLFIFQPSSAIYVKHYIATIQYSFNNPSFPNYSIENFVGGYCNTTSAVNAVIFRMSSGNIDAGTIKMYGISA
jgi:hypothetical protein